MNVIGMTIRLLRRQNEWSQEEVAIKLGISVPAFSKIETGITDLNLSRLEQIAVLFGLSISQLLSFGENAALNYRNDLETLTQLLEERDAELIMLQKKVIDLLEELKATETS